MAQTRRRKKPPKMLQLPDHELMERIFGKRIMKEVDRIVEDRSKDPPDSDLPNMKEL